MKFGVSSCVRCDARRKNKETNIKVLKKAYTIFIYASMLAIGLFTIIGGVFFWSLSALSGNSDFYWSYVVLTVISGLMVVLYGFVSLWKVD